METLKMENTLCPVHLTGMERHAVKPESRGEKNHQNNL